MLHDALKSDFQSSPRIVQDDSAVSLWCIRTSKHQYTEDFDGDPLLPVVGFKHSDEQRRFITNLATDSTKRDLF